MVVDGVKWAEMVFLGYRSRPALVRRQWCDVFVKLTIFVSGDSPSLLHSDGVDMQGHVDHMFFRSLLVPMKAHQFRFFIIAYPMRRSSPYAS
jgi:hypothetical protein